MSIQEGGGGLFVEQEAAAAAAASYILAYGVLFSGGPAFAVANGTVREAQVPLDGTPATDHVVAIAGRLAQLTINTVTATPTTIVRVFLDGAPVVSVTLTAAGPQVFPISVPVLAGQVVAVQFLSGVLPGASLFGVLVEP